MYSLLLMLHIAGACATILASVAAGVFMTTHASTRYRSIAIMLAWLATFEIMTGVMLAVFSPTVSAVSVCANIIVYLSVIAGIEFVLFRKMMHSSTRYPAIAAISPVGSALAILFGAVLLGV